MQEVAGRAGEQPFFKIPVLWDMYSSEWRRSKTSLRGPERPFPVLEEDAEAGKLGKPDGCQDDGKNGPMHLF